MSDDLAGLTEAEVEARLEEVRTRMRPLEQELAGIRSERDVLMTELRRRERLALRQRRAGVRDAVRSGGLATVGDLVAAAESGSFDDYTFNLKTGGEVRLGFPGARAQTVTFTDGRQVAQARDLAEAAARYAEGWEIGSPGRPGLRVHFPGTRQERLVDPAEVFASPRSESAEDGLT